MTLHIYNSTQAIESVRKQMSVVCLRVILTLAVRPGRTLIIHVYKEHK